MEIHSLLHDLTLKLQVPWSLVPRINAISYESHVFSINSPNYLYVFLSPCLHLILGLLPLRCGVARAEFFADLSVASQAHQQNLARLEAGLHIAALLL